MTLAFWKAIEAIPGLSTDNAEWHARLGDRWPFAERYLKTTSRFVDKVSCPFLGGPNCPRQVVRHPDGTVRAVCGDPERICDSLDLRLDDIRVVELDHWKLMSDIGKALSLDAKT